MRLYPAFVGGPGAAGLLLLRLVMGAAFVLHGLPKIQSPLDWMGKMGAPNPPPAFLQAAAAVAEFGGGLALVLGVLTPLAALGIICTMATAILMVHTPTTHPFVGPPDKGPYEPPLVYLACAVMFLLVGPGRISLDWLLFGRPAPRPAPGDAAPPGTYTRPTTP
jgi:putative oxidoreductase